MFKFLNSYITKQFIPLCLVALFMVGCSKSVQTNSTTTTTTTDNVYNPINNDTLLDYPRIRFFTVMDYGNKRIGVKLNTTKITTIQQYYPSTYFVANKGTNYITALYPDTGTASVLSRAVDLVSGSYYSCFFYRVGYEWKISVVKDDLSAPTNATDTKIRLLDFRTQAYFNYVNIRVWGKLTGDERNFTYRNFLDHETYSSNADFKTLTAGMYSIKVFNDSAVLKTRDSINFSAGNSYSIVLMTPSTLTPAAALKYIYPDVYKQNP